MTARHADIALTRPDEPACDQHQSGLNITLPNCILPLFTHAATVSIP
jgi:hypothetical protein